MKYRLKKDLPYAKKGTEVLKSEHPPMPVAIRERCVETFYWKVKVSEMKSYVIGDSTMNMSDWIEEIEEPRVIKMFSKLKPETLMQNFTPDQQGHYIRLAKNSIFFDQEVKKMNTSELLFTIGYLAEYIEDVIKQK